MTLDFLLSPKVKPVIPAEETDEKETNCFTTLIGKMHKGDRYSNE